MPKDYEQSLEDFVKELRTDANRFERHWVKMNKAGYNEHWADYSPGMQLMMDTVRLAFEQGLEGYEFLGADESWLRVWTNQSHATCTLVHYPYTAGGLTALGFDGVAHFARRMLRKR